RGTPLPAPAGAPGAAAGAAPERAATRRTEPPEPPGHRAGSAAGRCGPAWRGRHRPHRGRPGRAHVSTPRFLTLPPGVRRVDVSTPSGPIATLAAAPVVGGCELHSAVLVPGFTGSKEDFIALLQTLAQAGRRVYAIDLPRQYQSPGSDHPAAYSCAALGRVVADVVDAVGQGPVHLLGHSFGGLVTRETVLAGKTPLLSHTLMSSGPSGVEGPRRTEARRLMAVLGGSPTRELINQVWW